MKPPLPVVEVSYPGFPSVYALEHKKSDVLALFEKMDRWSKHADKVYDQTAARLRSMNSPTNEEINEVFADVQKEIGDLVNNNESILTSNDTQGRVLGLREHPRTKRDSEIFVPRFRGVVLRMLKRRFLLNEPAAVDNDILRMRFGPNRAAEAPPPPPPPPPAPPKQDVFDTHTLPGVIFRRLRELGFKPPPPFREEFRYGGEWVWTRPSRSRPNIEIRVFTTCFEKPDGSFGVKSTGADAIRVVAYYTKHGVPRALFAGRRILRTGEWNNIADRIAERVDAVEAEIQNWKTCAKCSAPLFESKKGNWVCADICWKPR